MAGEIDLFLQEKQTGQDFSKRIKNNFLSSIKKQTSSKSGEALKTTVKPVFKNGYLDRLTIFTPYYIYPILHTGFERKKSSGVNVRMKAYDFLTDALENGKLVEDLADIVGSQRADAILERTGFSFDKNNNTSNSLGNE
jgi:hypothetical protein